MAGLVLLLIKWLTITAVILAVPFGVWFAVDRSRRRPLSPRPLGPGPSLAVGMPASRLTTPGSLEPPTAPVPVPRRPTPRPLAVVPSAHGVTREELLAADREVVVTREEDHQDVLAGHHRPGGGPTPVTLELWSSSVTRGKYQGDYAIEVRLEGRRVGELTAAMSARYRHLVGVAGPVRCRGVVTHGRRGYQVDLKLPDVV